MIQLMESSHSGQAVSEVQGVVSCVLGERGFDDGLPCVV
jgi:hypothetical protein